jgi:hypothetical protein
MSLDGSYDMILLPPPRDSDNGGRQPARRRRNQRRLPHMAEEQHSGLSRRLLRRWRRRRGSHGQAGGGTSSAVERVNGAGAQTGDTSGDDLASETKTSAVSPQHANSKRTNDASTLARDLLGVTIVPETTVQSAPDATSSPPVDQEVPTGSHLVPFRSSCDPPSDPALVDAFIKACSNPPGYHMRSPWDRLTAVSTYGPSGSEEDDEPDFCWDFSGLGNPSAMRDFMTACDYCLFDCSDCSRSFGDEDCGPSRECFHVDLGGPGEGNHLGMPENGDPPRPTPRVDILRELAVVPVPAGGQDAQLEHIREMQARLDEGAGTLDPFRRNIGQEWADQAPAGEALHLPQGIQHALPTTSGQGHHRLPVGSARTWLQQHYFSARCRNHRPPKGGVSRESSRISWRMPRSDGPKALPPEGKGTPRSIALRLPDLCGKPRSTPGARATRRLRPRVASATSTTTAAVRDVNGDPIPANPWGIPLLGYVYGTKIVPMGTDMGQNLHPLGKWVWVWEAIIRTRLPMGISYVYTCHVCMNELRPSQPPSLARQRTRPQVLAQ